MRDQDIAGAVTALVVVETHSIYISVLVATSVVLIQVCKYLYTYTTVSGELENVSSNNHKKELCLC
jgi:hypothetical protein